MNKRIFSLALLIGLLASVPSFAQTALNTTTLSAAITPTQTTFVVGSTANITASGSTGAGTQLWIARTGELMRVVSIPVSGTVVVARAVSPTRPFAAASGATVVIVPSDATRDYDFQGPCNTAATTPKYRAYVNVRDGDLNVCLLSGSWQQRSELQLTIPTTLVVTP